MTQRFRRVAAATGLLAAGILVTPAAAEAAPAPPATPALAADHTGRAAKAFADKLGPSRTAGVFLDSSGQLTVSVTDESAAAAVRAAGGYAKIVAHSATYLNAIKAKLDASYLIGGASWGVDPRTGQVSIEADSSVSAADFTRLEAVGAAYGTAVHLDRISGRAAFAAAFTSGGQGIENADQTTKCSIGFNAQNSSGARYFITAGHCAAVDGISTWYKAADGTYLGTNHEVSFPNNDWDVVTYRNSAVTAYGTVWVNGAQKQITTSRDPYDGESVERVGTVSSDLNGEVLLTNVTQTVTESNGVKYNEFGLIKTSLCVQYGDSGGALFDGSTALGITSSGTDNSAACSTSSPTDERSYYQPVQEVLDHDGLTVY